MYLTDQVFLHGGVEQVLSRKASWLARQKEHQVQVVTTRQDEKNPVYPFDPAVDFIDLGIDYDITQSYFSIRNLRKIPEHLKKLKKVFKNYNPDVIISCNYAPDFYFLPFLAPSIPKIKEFHSSRYFEQPLGLKDRLLKWLGKRTEKRYNTLAVLNPSEVQFYHGSAVVIPNPAAPTSYRADLSSKRILAAGRISPVKDFGRLVDAFAELAPVFPDWELHIWGEKYLETQEELQRFIQQRGLQKQVHFMGITPDLRKQMQYYSIYAMTSMTECFPMVLLEALSLGLPIVSHLAPTGPQHIITHGSDGFLTEYHCKGELVERLRKLMEDEALRQTFSKNALLNVTRFHEDTIMMKWQDLFLSLTANG